MFITLAPRISLVYMILQTPSCGIMMCVYVYWVKVPKLKFSSVLSRQAKTPALILMTVDYICTMIELYAIQCERTNKVFGQSRLIGTWWANCWELFAIKIPLNSFMIGGLASAQQLCFELIWLSGTQTHLVVGLNARWWFWGGKTTFLSDYWNECKWNVLTRLYKFLWWIIQSGSLVVLLSIMLLVCC